MKFTTFLLIIGGIIGVGYLLSAIYSFGGILAFVTLFAIMALCFLFYEIIVYGASV